MDNNPLRGEVWVAGTYWHVTSYGLEAANGSCALPGAILCHNTLTNASKVMPQPVLAEYVSAFNFALVLHGHCPTVDPAIALEWLRKHFMGTAPTPPTEAMH